MLLHYIELISEYQDSRRSEDVGEPSSDTDTPQQDTPDMPPPPELVQSIKSASGDLPACDAVIVQNLQQTPRRWRSSAPSITVALTFDRIGP